jgi:hypothetical protein
MFFLQGPGSTGKTFVENHLLAKVRADGDIALAVASAGIASLLLGGRRTAHSLYKLPLDCPSGCNLPIARESPLAEFLRRAKHIIWDEATMQHRLCAEAVNRCLEDLTEDPQFFGGSRCYSPGIGRRLYQSLSAVVSMIPSAPPSSTPFFGPR